MLTEKKDPLNYFIGRYVRIFARGGTLRGLYRGTTIHGDMVLIPNLGVEYQRDIYSINEV